MRPPPDPRRHRRSRFIDSRLLALIIAILLLVLTAPPAVAAPTPSPTPLTKTSVRVEVLNMSVTTPQYSTSPQPVVFTLRITNTTDRALKQVTLTARRDPPLNQQKLLYQAFSATPTPSRISSGMHSVPIGALAANEFRTLDYVATVSSLDDGSTDICECATAAIYPIDFNVAASLNASGATTAVGTTQTYLTSFQQTPTPVQVSWIWPLIDRPHRVTENSVFLDDDLGVAVAPGGRLDRSLQVLEGVSGKAAVTVLVDPELISELLAMSDGYTVASAAPIASTTGLATPSGTPVPNPTSPGAHSAQAANWLARFRAVAAQNQIEFTPDADPDTEALVKAKLGWSSAISAQVAGQATGLASHDLAWPADGVVSPTGLTALAATGVSTVVVDDSVLPQPEDDDYAASSLAHLTATTATGTPLNAIVTDSVIQKLAATAVSTSTSSTTNTSALPDLVASVAMRAAAEPDAAHYVAIAAPRFVSPSVPSAVRAILETAATSWSAAMTVASAVGTLTPDPRDPEVDPGEHASISAQAVRTNAQAADFAKTFADTFVAPADAAKVLAGYPEAAQRAASTAWREFPDAAQHFDSTLTGRINALRDAVHIVRPSSGSYTLASNDAPLFVSVLNTLAYPVQVQVRITTVGTVRGLTTENIGAQTIQASGSQVTLRVPAHVQRSGRFEVQAELLTPAGAPLGNPVGLNVRSTALGTIGVIITIVAGAILALALLLRLIRRVQRRGRTGSRSGRPAAHGLVPVGPEGTG